jgi:hypothetical protein
MHITFRKGGVSAAMSPARMPFSLRFAALLDAEVIIVSGTPLHIDLSGTNYFHRGVRVETEAPSP